MRGPIRRLLLVCMLRAGRLLAVRSSTSCSRSVHALALGCPQSEFPMPTQRPSHTLIGPAVATLLVTAAIVLGVESFPAPAETGPSQPAPDTNDQFVAERLQPLPAAPVRQAFDPPPPAWRLPQPPEQLSVTKFESAPILELLPPIPAEDLAADQGDCFEELLTEEPEPEPQIEKEDLLTTAPATLQPPVRVPDVKPSRAFEVDEFDEDAQLAASTSVEDVLAYFPAEKQLSKQFQPRVQEIYTLARHGALHAARARFEQLLLELAQAKDATQMTSRHTRALATGLRAIEEADDFLARDTTTTTPQQIAAGHQTPMLHEGEVERILPHEAVAMYHLYAQQKLALAVEGEQAGSMMLFGLGKIYAQLAERDDRPQAVRKSLTMYRSAVGAHGGNHLAANEAGVLLARAGRYEQAAAMFERSAQLANSSATHRNLAYVMAKLERTQQAEAHRAAAEQIARQEIALGQLSAERGITWVSPDEFARRTSGGGPAAVASRPAAPQPTTAPPTTAPPASAPRAAQQSPAHPMWW